MMLGREATLPIDLMFQSTTKLALIGWCPKCTPENIKIGVRNVTVGVGSYRKRYRLFLKVSVPFARKEFSDTPL